MLVEFELFPVRTLQGMNSEVMGIRRVDLQATRGICAVAGTGTERGMDRMSNTNSLEYTPKILQEYGTIISHSCTSM